MERPSLVLTSQRTTCPHCRLPLQQAKPGQTGAVAAQIIAEPAVFTAWHLSRSCPASCKQATYWRGFVAFRILRTKQRCTLLKEVDLPDPDHFFLNSRRAWQDRGSAAGGTECFCTEPAFKVRVFFCGSCTPVCATTSAISFAKVGSGRSFTGELWKPAPLSLRPSGRMS